jgi:uncharacterized protein
LSVFVDSSAWFASIVARDHHNSRAKTIMQGEREHITTDHVVVETWLLLNARFHHQAADLFWERIRIGRVQIEQVSAADFEAAWSIGKMFADQNFSIVDRTSFAVMERLGLTRAISFDDDFAVYRYGRNRDRAFEVLR